MTLSVVKAPLTGGRPITATTFADLTTVPVVTRPDGSPAIDYPFLDPMTGNTVVKVTFGDPIVNGSSTYPALTWAVKQACARRIMTPSAAAETLLNQVAALPTAPASSSTTDQLSWLVQMVTAMAPIVLGQGDARVDDSS